MSTAMNKGTPPPIHYGRPSLGASEKHSISQTKDKPVMNTVTVHGENNCLDSEDTLTPPMDLVVLVPVYCPDTDNVYPIVVKLKHRQKLSPQKSQPFTDFTPGKEMGGGG